MVKYTKIGFGMLFIVGMMASCQSPQPTQTAEASVNQETSPMQEPEKLRHVVLFKFKDEAPEEEVAKIHQSFQDLQTAIPQIRDFEWGMNDSPENFHQDFTHCYFITFDTEYDRDSIYTPHPAHQAFVASLQPHLEKVFVVDYWAN
ncbi:MAG: Dabb family protein [Cytophagales bacterium]|nr:Dabb family protein [Cytophagales bacterium]